MSIKKELIMVVPTDKVLELVKEGVNSFTDSQLKELLNNTAYRPRYLMELDESFKQVIPYIIVKNSEGGFLTYMRSSSGGETRLHNQYSIGVGGHLDINGLPKTPMFEFFAGALREIEEELGFVADPDDLHVVNTILDLSDSVGRVHLGVVCILNADIPLNSGEQDVLVNREYLTLDYLKGRSDDLENWSKMLVSSGSLVYLFNWDDCKKCVHSDKTPNEEPCAYCTTEEPMFQEK